MLSSIDSYQTLQPGEPVMNSYSPPKTDKALSELLENARNFLNSGRLDEAATACVHLAKHYPELSEGWILLSKVSLALKKLPMAVNAALRAIDSDRSDPECFMQLSRCYLVSQEWGQARKALGYAQQQATEDADQLSQLGTLLFEANLLDEALECYNHAIDVDPQHIASLYNRAAVRRFTGDNTGAEDDYRHLLKQQPSDFEACHNVMQLRSYSPTEPMLELIENCIQRNPEDWRAQVQLGYAKGKYYEDSKNYDQAFDAYIQAATLKRQNSHYDLEKDIELMRELPSMFEGFPGLKYESGSSSPTPVFVTGLPRTGTTLVERIISSHSDVVSGGELNSFPLAMLEASGLDCFSDPFGISIKNCRSIKPEQLKLIRDRYLKLSLDRLGQNANTSRFLDKLPYNALFMGFILSAFPDARIIHLNRNSMDAAWSNFKMLFNHGYGYSYDLNELGQYMIAHQKMMDAWVECFPGKIHQVKYEELVEDPKTEISNMLDFCELPVESACFDFHKNTAASLTASASQVRQPMYRNSIDHWKNFENQISPLKEMFVKAGINI
ncbi:sulfotransferase [Aestuariicella sp. G3-2]|uniref:tetratricopeptide repeat-containing sulfotransferase family protein n=1 Tax=Pseudomaricurvus albidus TaxID=2842452 RepID=UPI001C0E2762|nr:tetratricopeptide repeat-containing sulfotransferase family protein [Aestuariicella albida]MBU3071318.1 sulfotransferase [Aestuariicella albida]